MDYAETREKLKTFEAKDFPQGYFEMMPRRGVRHTLFGSEVPHNAIWDFAISPEGRMFLSLCAELNASTCGRLYEYIPETGELVCCFDIRDIVLPLDRAIPPSKIHSSISFLDDGRLIMTTHTTAQAPGHPTWMPEAYYYHIWEGYQGSNIIIYDPKTLKADNLGVPVPRETIYGAALDNKHNALYFSGYFRGHLYRFDIDSSRVSDLGQVTEFGSFRFHRAPDGHIYSASRSGFFYRVNTDTGKIEDLGIRFPYAKSTRFGPTQRRLNFCADGPDGRMYLGVIHCDSLLAYNPRTNTLEDFGSYIPDNAKLPDICPTTIGGLSFDKGGCLWYGIMAFSDDWVSMSVRLARWDVLRGGHPEMVGLTGTPDQNICCVSEMFIADEKLYIADTNHGNDPPGVFAADLNCIREDMYKPRELSRDPMSYMCLTDAETICPDSDIESKMEPCVRATMGVWRHISILSENPHTVQCERTEVYRLWREVPIESSAVKSLAWGDDGGLYGVCGEDELFGFVIRSGSITPSPIDTAPGLCRDLAERSTHDTNFPSFASLPAQPGRQYLARASAVAKLNGERFLVGTEDGMLALANANGSVYSLGQAVPYGPIRQIVTDSTQTKAFGIGGDCSDLGTIFYYDDKIGVRRLGRVFFCEAREPGLAASCELSAAALTSDGNRLAVGSSDRMGCVYILNQVSITT